MVSYPLCASAPLREIFFLVNAIMAKFRLAWVDYKLCKSPNLFAHYIANKLFIAHNAELIAIALWNSAYFAKNTSISV
jgi:hypothetical protein